MQNISRSLFKTSFRQQKIIRFFLVELPLCVYSFILICNIFSRTLSISNNFNCQLSSCFSSLCRYFSHSSHQIRPLQSHYITHHEILLHYRFILSINSHCFSFFDASISHLTQFCNSIQSNNILKHSISHAVTVFFQQFFTSFNFYTPTTLHNVTRFELPTSNSWTGTTILQTFKMPSVLFVAMQSLFNFATWILYQPHGQVQPTLQIRHAKFLLFIIYLPNTIEKWVKTVKRFTVTR